MKKIKTQLFSLLILFILSPLFISCDTDVEAEVVQRLKTYDEQYYANLRAYKKSDHTLFFGYYAAYAPIEGVEDPYKDPASWGERIMGLPDSLDIVNLWMGVPSEDFLPVAYEDMKHCQQVKGTRFVIHADASKNQVFTYEGKEYDLGTEMEDGDQLEAYREEALKAYGKYLVQWALDAGVDGIDIDYEPASGSIWSKNSKYIAIVAEAVGEFFGPRGKYPDVLFMIDFFTHYPPEETEPYVDYYIRQAYTQGFTEHSATRLQSYYNLISWAPPSKFIVVENFGSWYENGGSPFTEADGNTLTTDGSRMYSLEGMARWNPTQGRKGGFGAFYLDRDYFSKTGIPYYNLRRCIQIVNPAVY
ncbi:MAG: glycoside hydrolase family 18 [Bacteroides sp.]|nr:glycoside hydrolase family 18 [Bacteroides sp.]